MLLEQSRARPMAMEFTGAASSFEILLKPASLITFTDKLNDPKNG